VCFCVPPVCLRGFPGPPGREKVLTQKVCSPRRTIGLSPTSFKPGGLFSQPFNLSQNLNWAPPHGWGEAKICGPPHVTTEGVSKATTDIIGRKDTDTILTNWGGPPYQPPGVV